MKHDFISKYVPKKITFPLKIKVNESFFKSFLQSSLDSDTGTGYLFNTRLPTISKHYQVCFGLRQQGE